MVKDMLLDGLQSLITEDGFLGLLTDGRCCHRDIVFTDKFLKVETDGRYIPIEILLKDDVIKQSLVKFGSLIEANLHVTCQLAKK